MTYQEKISFLRRYREDDAQVASETSEKFWANTPGIFIRVEVLG